MQMNCQASPPITITMSGTPMPLMVMTKTWANPSLKLRCRWLKTTMTWLEDIRTMRQHLRDWQWCFCPLKEDNFEDVVHAPLCGQFCPKKCLSHISSMSPVCHWTTGSFVILNQLVLKNANLVFVSIPKKNWECWQTDIANLVGHQCQDLVGSRAHLNGWLEIAFPAVPKKITKESVDSEIYLFFGYLPQSRHWDTMTL